MPLQRTLLASGASCVTFSPDGTLLATGHVDGYISLLRPAAITLGGPTTTRVAAPEERFLLGEGRGAVEVVAFAPSGDLLACGSHERVIDVLQAPLIIIHPLPY